jgi:purine-binding chemotaxis protein CheW
MPSASPRSAAPRQVVVFTLGEEAYAFPIDQVQEIIRYTRPRSVASRVEWVRGVINLRGRVLPIYDLAARLGVPSSAGEGAKIIIIESSGETGGVIVDDVEEVQTIEEQQLETVPTVDSALIDAIAKLGDELVVLLKPDKLFDGAP